jgi:hypothetical protein
VIFRNRMAIKPVATADIHYPVLDPEAYLHAKQVAPGYDVYYLEQEWQSWWFESGMPEIVSPGKAFVGFCRSRYKRNPNP